MPVFYHKLNSRDLIAYNNSIVEKNHFSNTALSWFIKKIEDISNDSFVEERENELLKITNKISKSH